ncbi:hypothetical protein RirG_031860 [Rhizophagus irregularis DAOM 197198w]|uniref:Uncharacterized protein n=1 Tax=Rhizophagus irregularis (strain DAOM 197198w) TaxID=1432141 RepID=A0A015K487_RHIIW|nr:hypothetical protein RirG_031860 [Rhizophagus irregularis DAOM 197198w]
MRAPKTGFPVATRAPGACGTAGGHTAGGAPALGGEQERSLPGRPLNGRPAGTPPASHYSDPAVAKPRCAGTFY